MSKTLGQQIVVQNVGGAGGTTGSTRAMRADPDGYTILMGQMGTHAAAPALYPNLAYRPDADFEPIGLVTSFPVLIAARKDFPANNLKEFVAYVKANHAKLNMGHAGVGSIFFTTCLLLNSILDVKPTLVPFGGGAPTMTALMGGQIDYMCGDIIVGGPPHAAGQIKVYAIAAPKRNPALPDVPSTPEAGLPAFQASAWNGLFAPKGTPKPIARPARRRARQGARRRDLAQAHARSSAATFPDKAERGRSRSSRWSRGDRALVADHQGDRCEDELSSQATGSR